MFIPRLFSRKTGAAVAVPVGLLVLACTLPSPSAARLPEPAPEAQRAESGDLVCEAYCSPAAIGTAVVEVRFVVPGGAAPAASLRARAANQDIEASVYEDGFERGLFVRLPSVSAQARFAAPAGVAASAKAIPGLDRLVVRAVATAQDPPGALRLAQPSDASPPAPGGVILQVQGLQPGMNYYWRVRPGPGADPQIVMCRAPICPVDRRRPAPRPGPGR